MELILQRTRLKDDYTSGQLYVDGVYFCFTLEDRVREVNGQPVEKWKVFGQTAIPTGVYDISFQNSPKFGPQTLTVLKVPGFEEVRIHSGNTVADTEGCILVGSRINSDGVIVPGTSKPTLLALKQAITLPCRLRILNPYH